MSNWRELQYALIKFRNDRDWEQFHSPKNLAMALSVEASELVEEFPTLAAYRRRCEARPAFKRALADHMAPFAAHAP